MPNESDAVRTLNTSQDPAELARATQVLAASTRAEDHKLLLNFLKSPGFQAHLDPPTEIDTGPDDRWMARPLRTLASNSSASARQTLLELIGDAAFTANVNHVDLLLTASIQLRPPTPVVVDFWRKYDGPETVHSTRAVSAILENGDPLAAAEFERLLVDTAPAPPDEGGDPRVFWLRGPFLHHRDNPAVLAMAERLLARPQPPNWTAEAQTWMAEAVFLHLDEWYRPHQEVAAPPLAKTPPEGRRTLRHIAELTRQNLHPSPILEAGIKTTLAQLDAMEK